MNCLALMEHRHAAVMRRAEAKACAPLSSDALSL
jgi:hypothetical protein